MLGVLSDGGSMGGGLIPAACCCCLLLLRWHVGAGPARPDTCCTAADPTAPCCTLALGPVPASRQ